MESNDAFEAEVEIEVLNRSTSHSNKTKKGPDAFTAAYGSIDTPKAGQGEEEPLLGYSGNSDTNDGDDSRGGAPIWTGYKDFEGRPWWRKPSVRSGCDDRHACFQRLRVAAIDMVASSRVHSLHHVLRWHHCHQD